MQAVTRPATLSRGPLSITLLVVLGAIVLVVLALSHPWSGSAATQSSTSVPAAKAPSATANQQYRQGERAGYGDQPASGKRTPGRSVGFRPY